jgi:hypothetical protein
MDSAMGNSAMGGSAMGVTTVTRVKLLPLWRWTTHKHGDVVASGVALTEKKAWSASIAKAPKAG